MFKAVGKEKDGRALVILGLTERNVDRLKSDPGNDMLKIDCRQLGIEGQVGHIVILYGKDEATIGKQFEDMIGPMTRVHIDEKLKQ
jgi:hypothetical protein